MCFICCAVKYVLGPDVKASTMCLICCVVNVIFVYRLWWSNGVSVRAVRGTGEQIAESITTAKGERDNSLTGSISSVHFPGVYSFEG